MGMLSINISASKSSWGCSPCGSSSSSGSSSACKPQPAKPSNPCKSSCKPKKGMAIGFGVMPLGMIAFGGFGLGKFC